MKNIYIIWVDYFRLLGSVIQPEGTDLSQAIFQNPPLGLFIGPLYIDDLGLFIRLLYQMHHLCIILGGVGAFKASTSCFIFPPLLLPRSVCRHMQAQHKPHP